MYLHHHFPLKVKLLRLIRGCFDPSWHADGYCDDDNNKEACFFDGGDCCGPNVNTEYCTECQCLSDGGSSGGCSDPDWVGDDFCNDGNNNQECNYDGGDCCGSNIGLL